MKNAEFIQSLDIEQPILFVITKADRKPAAQIQQIIDTARNDLMNAELPVLDVIGYSSQANQEFSASGTVLKEMLDTINQGKQGSTLLWQSREIFRHYQSHYQTSIETLKLSLKTLNELQFDESISNANRKHLGDMHAKTKAQLNSLTRQQNSASKMQQQLEQQIETLCQQLQLTLSKHPNRVQLRALNKQQTETATSDYQFEALLRGPLNHLSHAGELNHLPGEVAKVSPVGISINIKQPLELFIPRQTLEKQLTTAEWQSLLYVGCPVEVQVVSAKLALIRPTPHPQTQA